MHRPSLDKHGKPQYIAAHAASCGITRYKRLD